MKIKYVFLPIIAFAVEFLFSHFGLPEWLTFSLEYGILLGFVMLNVRSGGLWPFFVGAGAGLNFLVISLNGFKMPLYAGILENAGKSETLAQVAGGQYFGYGLLDEGTRLGVLGDVIGISFFDRLIGFASVGDVLLLIGVALLSFRLLKPLFRRS